MQKEDKSVSSTRSKRSGTSKCSSGIHERLYARSNAKQKEGKLKRQQMEKKLAPKPTITKKISANQASSLYDRLYVDGIEKQISLGKKIIEVEKIEVEKFENEKVVQPILSNRKADTLYNRLHVDAVTKQMKEWRLEEGVKPKVRVITLRQTNNLYERLYDKTTLSLHNARNANE